MGIAYNTSVVKDGLVLHLDAANPKSYPGSGAVWSDLSGNGRNGTLVNGVGYSADNKGAMVFDGIDDYVDCGLSTFQPTQMTLCSWVRKTSSGDGGIIIKGDVNEATEWGLSFGYSNPLLLVGRPVGYMTQVTYPWTGSLFSGFHHVALTVINSSTVRLYIDGVEVASRQISSNIGLNNKNVLIGKWNNHRTISGRVSQSMIYNRALTAAEIRQNFEAYRGRYGI